MSVESVNYTSDTRTDHGSKNGCVGEKCPNDVQQLKYSTAPAKPQNAFFIFKYKMWSLKPHNICSKIQVLIASENPKFRYMKHQSLISALVKVLYHWLKTGAFSFLILLLLFSIASYKYQINKVTASLHTY